MNGGARLSALGDRASALDWLTRAVDERSQSRAFFNVDSQLASLRDDPRFAALARRRAAGSDGAVPAARR